MKSMDVLKQAFCVVSFYSLVGVGIHYAGEHFLPTKKRWDAELKEISDKNWSTELTDEEKDEYNNLRAKSRLLGYVTCGAQWREWEREWEEDRPKRIEERQRYQEFVREIEERLLSYEKTIKRSEESRRKIESNLDSESTAFSPIEGRVNKPNDPARTPLLPHVLLNFVGWVLEVGKEEASEIDQSFIFTYLLIMDLFSGKNNQKDEDACEVGEECAVSEVVCKPF